MLRKHRSLVFLLVFCQLFLSCFPAQAGDPRVYIARLLRREANKPERPVTNKDQAVEQLARNIDWLERELDQWGTITAKSPDVWGESRLTKHRGEFERVLAAELMNFDPDRLQGAQFVQDQSFLAMAFGLRNVVTEGNAQGLPAGNAANIPNISINLPNVGQTTVGEAAANSQMDIPDPTQTIFGDVNLSTDPEGQVLGITQRFQLEQTQVLDQLSRYVNHLHEIRRINEGDDIGDSPGYAAHLLRVPVSILPGKKTKDGYGAEITFTAEPYLGPELLPIAFRDLVINDLVDQIAIPLTKFLNSEPADVQAYMQNFGAWLEINQTLWRLPVRETVPTLGLSPEGSAFLTLQDEQMYWTGRHFELQDKVAFETEVNTLIQHLLDKDKQYKVIKSALVDLQIADSEVVKVTAALQRLSTLSSESNMPAVSGMEFLNTLPLNQQTRETLETWMSPPSAEEVKPFVPQATPREGAAISHASEIRLTSFQAGRPAAGLQGQAAAELQKAVAERMRQNAMQRQSFEFIRTQLQRLEQRVRRLELSFAESNVPPNATRRSTLPFPPSQMTDVYGYDVLGFIAVMAYDAFRNDVINRHVVHVPDVQSLLREELHAAFEALRTSTGETIWSRAYAQHSELREQIRLRNMDFVEQYRREFFGDLTRHPTASSMTSALAWCTLVESILLNDRLNRDIRETMGSHPGFQCSTPETIFFGPNPSAEARQAFAEYTKARWPIRVFTVDPVNTEQNIGDVSSIVRQMQLAVAVSFASGDIGAGAAMQAMRQLQRDTATIDLRRTAVGFGHGSDTFGWRFYPRFQTPPVQGNLGAMVRDLIVGGPTDRALERRQEIEPGMRECTAVVLMPSFVPHLTLQTHSNWHGLANPQCSGTSMAENMEFSRVVRQSRELAHQCVRFQQGYRDGELDRVLAKVKQLDRELPLQTLETQVPIENTLGGFEIFGTGTRELVPELLGWYGSPGYDPERGCRLFLAGENFSVHETRLIAGNREISLRLLSKQTMEVTLPAGLPVINDPRLWSSSHDDYSGYVDAQVATPNGVSGHLLIPVVRSSSGNRLLRPRVTSPQVEMWATVENDQVTGLPTRHPSQWLGVEIPTGVGLDFATRNFTVHLTNGVDKIAEVTIANVPLSVDRTKFLVPLSVLDSQQVITGSTLGKEIKDYLDLLLARGLFPNDGVQLTVRLTLAEGASSVFPAVECDGETTLIIRRR